MIDSSFVVFEVFPILYQWRSHKSTLTDTTLSPTCGVTKLHMSILYFITVIFNYHMVSNNLKHCSYFIHSLQIQLESHMTQHSPTPPPN